MMRVSSEDGPVRERGAGSDNQATGNGDQNEAGTAFVPPKPPQPNTPDPTPSVPRPACPAHAGLTSLVDQAVAAASSFTGWRWTASSSSAILTSLPTSSPPLSITWL